MNVEWVRVRVRVSVCVWWCVMGQSLSPGRTTKFRRKAGETTVAGRELPSMAEDNPHGTVSSAELQQHRVLDLLKDRCDTHPRVYIKNWGNFGEGFMFGVNWRGEAKERHLGYFS